MSLTDAVLDDIEKCARDERVAVGLTARPDLLRLVAEVRRLRVALEKVLPFADAEGIGGESEVVRDALGVPRRV